MEKNSGSLQLYTDGGVSIPKAANTSVPNLDPTLVKAVSIQESNAGVRGSTTDIMQSNNKGDWGGGWKANFGLQKGVTPDVKTSINAGIIELAAKGFRGGSDGSGNFKFQGWDKAGAAYNGPGAAKYGQDYLGSIKKMVSNSSKPKPSDYVN
jgi:hypothetical protein